MVYSGARVPVWWESSPHRHQLSDLVTTSLHCLSVSEGGDSDELMMTLALDDLLADLFYSFSPFFNLLLLTKPYEISKNASMSDPIIASASCWLESQRHPSMAA